jgi:hypothetical protein
MKRVFFLLLSLWLAFFACGSAPPVMPDRGIAGLLARVQNSAIINKIHSMIHRREDEKPRY